MNDLERIRTSAEMAVREMGPLSGLDANFGFNRESVEWVEAYIERLRSSGRFGSQRAIENLSAVVGSFLGECIVRVYGGEWRNQDGRWGVYFSDRSAAFPFSKVMKQA